MIKIFIQKLMWSTSKGAGSYSGQGGRIAQKGYPGRRKWIAGSRGKSRAAGANRGQWGQIVQKRHFAMFFIISFLLILAIKHKKKFVHSCPPGQRATGAVTYSGPIVLQPWLNLSILIEENPTLQTTHQRAYSRAHAGTLFCLQKWLLPKFCCFRITNLTFSCFHS